MHGTYIVKGSLPSSGLSRSVKGFDTDVSGVHIGAIFNLLLFK